MEEEFWTTAMFGAFQLATSLIQSVRLSISVLLKPGHSYHNALPQSRIFECVWIMTDRLCGLVVRVLGY
jgi:hypothetical protein